MFSDELERLDRALNCVAILRKRRLRAYYEFRDQSEPEERIAHSGPPEQNWPSAYWPVNTDVCSICGETFSDRREYRRHFSQHREASSAAAPASVAAASHPPAPVSIVISPQPGLASHPILIAGCTVAQVLEAMRRAGNARAGLDA